MINPLKRKLISAGVLWCGWVSGPASFLTAQQADAPLLTLNAALDDARQHSPRLRGSRQGVVTRQESVRTAKSERLPQLNLGTAFLGTNLRTETALGFPSTPFAEIPENQAFRQGHLNAVISATVPVYTGGRIESATRLAQANEGLAQASERDVDRDLAFDVTSSYARIVELDRDTQAAQESVNALTESQRVIEQMLSVGKVARVDRLKVVARLADIRSHLIDFRNAREIQAGELNDLMGRAIDTPFKVETSLPQQPVPVPPEQWAQSAVAGNTKYQVAQAGLGVAARSLDVAKAELRPSFSVAANFLGQSADPFTAYKTGAMAGVVFSFPLFDRTLNHQVQEAKSRELERRAEVAQAKLDAVQRTRTASLQIQDAEERIRAMQASIDSAREALRIEQEKERYGRTTIENVLDAQAALLTSEADYYHALADHTIAIAALKRETGR